MSDSTDDPSAIERSVLDLIRAIQAGTLPPRTLTVAERLACSEHLMYEGFGTSEIAAFLKVDVRTARRYRSVIADRNAVRYDPRLTGVIAGRLMAETEAAVYRVRKITRAADTPASVKVDAEYKALLMLGDMTRLLLAMGLLPVAVPSASSAEIVTALREEIERVDLIRRELVPDHVGVADTFERAKESLRTLEAEVAVDAARAAVVHATEIQPSNPEERL